MQREHSFSLERIGQIAVSVKDLPRAVEFYRDRLGMRLLFQVPGMAFFDLGGVRLMLGVPEGIGTPGASVIYYRVDDIEAGYRALSDRGVEFIDKPHRIAQMPDHDLWMAFLRDVDGNVLALMSEVRPPVR